MYPQAKTINLIPKNKKKSKREQLPFRSDILQNQESYFISKRNYTLQYTKTLREDIMQSMKLKCIGWTEICRKLKSINYKYNPISLQLQVKGKTNIPKDINYFVPILIMLEGRKF